MLLLLLWRGSRRGTGTSSGTLSPGAWGRRFGRLGSRCRLGRSNRGGGGVAVRDSAGCRCAGSLGAGGAVPALATTPTTGAAGAMGMGLGRGSRGLDCRMRWSGRTSRDRSGCGLGNT